MLLAKVSAVTQIRMELSSLLKHLESTLTTVNNTKIHEKEAEGRPYQSLKLSEKVAVRRVSVSFRR